MRNKNKIHAKLNKLKAEGLSFILHDTTHIIFHGAYRQPLRLLMFLIVYCASVVSNDASE